MVNFIGSESRGYTRFIEDSVERLQGILLDKEVRRRLGGTADRLYRMSETLYVPNVTGGQVDVPDAYLESNDVAVVALRPWEKISLGPNYASFTPRRREQALRTISQLQPINGSRAWFDDYRAAILRHAYRNPTETRGVRGDEGGSAARASTYRLDPGEFKATDEPEFHARPRSLVLLRRQHGSISPPVLAHELTHVVQADRQPVFVSDGKSDNTREIGEEFEAYYVGAEISTRMLELGRKITASDRRGLQVDQARRSVNTKRGIDRFAATPERIKVLGQQGLLKNLLDNE